MTLNPDFVLNCVLRQHVCSSEAWLSKHGYSLILVRNVVGELQPKTTLAASRAFLAAARLSCFTIPKRDRHRLLRQRDLRYAWQQRAVKASRLILLRCSTILRNCPGARVLCPSGNYRIRSDRCCSDKTAVTGPSGRCLIYVI